MTFDDSMKPGKARREPSRYGQALVRAASRSAVAFLAGAPIAFAPAAFAQAAQPAAPETQAAENADIIVTARQRSENIQQVPIAITAVTGEQLAKAGVDSLGQASSRVPGLQFGGNTVRVQTFTGVRGVGDYSRNPGFDNRVGIYLDGVYVGRSNVTDYPFVDVSQIEVLRGPQGTLFGKDTLTGAISITSNAPTPDFSVHAAVDGGERNYFTGSASINVPLTSNLYALATVTGRHQDGYQHNILNGVDYGNDDLYGGRLRLRFAPSAATTIDFAADYIHDRTDQLLADPLVGTVQGNQAPAIREVAYNASPTRERELYGVSATINQKFASDFQLTSITSYRYAKSAFLHDDLDLSSLDLAAANFRDKSDQFSEEARLASPAGKTFDFVVGVFYYQEKPRNDLINTFGSQFPAPPVRGQSILVDSDVKSQTFAAFAHGTFHITDRWSLDGGLRYNRVHKSLTYRQHLTSPAVNAVLRYVEIAPYEDSFTENWLDPTVSLRYKATDDVNLYASYSRGKRPGGWNADFVQYTNLRFNPETVDSYEIGAKALLFDRALRLNIAAYEMKFSNLQVTQLLIPAGATTVAPTISNAGQATSKGIEADFQINPVHGLRIGGGLAYNEANFDKFPDGGGPGVSYDGKRLVQAPRFTAAVNAEYRLPIGGGKNLLFGSDYTYTSLTYSDPSNAPDYRQPAHGLVGARIALELSHWEVSLWVRNLANVTYAQDRFISALLVPGVVYNEPRRIGAELKAHF